MDKMLLRRVALQSLAIMIAVITFSYAKNQYQTVTIEAVGQTKEAVEKITASDTAIVVNNSLSSDPKIKLTSVQKLTQNTDQSIIDKLGDTYLVIKKPQGDHLDLQLEDLYINKSIQLTMTGIVKDDISSKLIARVKGEDIFTGEPKYTQTTTTEVDKEKGTSTEVVTKDYGNDVCHGITIKSTQDESSRLYTDKMLIELDKVYAYIIYEDADYYYIALKKPSEVYDKVIVVDAGHGGKDGGALSRDNKYFEKNLNLEILLDLKKLLDKDKSIKVYYTRTSDDTVFLRPRVELANEVDCDYFISIHCNANALSSPNGTEVLYYNKEFKGVKSKNLATLFSAEVAKTVNLQKKGIVERHNDDVYIMHRAKVPMILIEVGYVTNYNDISYLSKDNNRKSVAEGIYNGIIKAYQKLPVDK